MWDFWGGQSQGYAIDAKSCLDPVCKFVNEYKEVTNKSKDEECSHYYWKKRKAIPHFDNYGWNPCYLKRNYFKLGYNLLKNEKDNYAKFTIGISRCFQKPIHHQWGNASGTGSFL